jgi:hypothetical protein
VNERLRHRPEPEPARFPRQVAPTGTPYERLADQVAHRLTGALPPTTVERATTAEPVPPVVDRVLSRAGEPLPDEVRRRFENRLGHDFSTVRIHSDALAAASAEAVRATAWSAGRHIVLGARAASASLDTNRTLAHEVGHVAQEAAGRQGQDLQVHRDPPPDLAPALALPQKPYFVTDEILAEVYRARAALSQSPPQFDLAQSYVRAAYHALDRLITSGRSEVAERTMGHGVWSTVVDARNAAGEMNGRILAAKRDLELRGDAVTGKVVEQEIARIEFAVPELRELEESVSYEVSEARRLPDVPSRFSRLSRAQAHVLAWLTLHRGEIAAVSARFGVDRRAVAGAVAWEATEQVKTGSIRGVGPGKVHAFEFKGRSAAEETVALGFVKPAGGIADMLGTVPGALEFVAGIMGAIADISDRHGLNIRNDPGVLTTVYQGWSPIEWGEHLASKRAVLGNSPWPRPVVANPMGLWTERYLPYLEEAVGFIPAEKQALGEKPQPATPSGAVASVP